MNHRDPARGEPDLDDLLHELAEDDRQAAAPAHVRAAVLGEWDTRHASVAVDSSVPPMTVVSSATAPARRRPWLPQLAGVAAAAVVVMAWLVAQFMHRPPAGVPSHAPGLRMTPSDAAMTTLVTEPPFDTEPLQLVRVRMPRERLRAFGVALVDPEVASDVEVDMLVGDDGIPRSIRRVRPIADGSQERNQ